MAVLNVFKCFGAYVLNCNERFSDFCARCKERYQLILAYIFLVICGHGLT